MAEREHVRRCDLQLRERIRVPRRGSAELCLRLPEPGHRCLYRHEPVSWQPARGASWQDRYAINLHQSRRLVHERKEKGLRTLSTSTRSPSLSGSSLRPSRTGANPSESSWERALVSDQRPGESRDWQSCREVAERRGSNRRLYASRRPRGKLLLGSADLSSLAVRAVLCVPAWLTTRSACPTCSSKSAANLKMRSSRPCASVVEPSS